MFYSKAHQKKTIVHLEEKIQQSVPPSKAKMKQCTEKENTADPQEENSRWCFSWMECLHSFPQGSDIIHSTTDELWRQITVLLQLQDVLIPKPRPVRVVKGAQT